MAVIADPKEFFGELGAHLIHRAGYGIIDDNAVKGGQYAEEYEQILRALLYIGNRKVDDYGDFRLTDIRSWDRETWGAYWDIQRKFGRLDTQLREGTVFLRSHRPGGDVSPHGLAQIKIVGDMMETLADQAVYCVRMIQVLRRLEEKGLVP